MCLNYYSKIRLNKTISIGLYVKSRSINNKDKNLLNYFGIKKGNISNATLREGYSVWMEEAWSLVMICK